MKNTILNNLSKVNIFMTNIIKKAVDFIIRYRYAIAGCIFILLVALKINFSSIGIWSDYVSEPDSQNVIFGKARAIRSDEWLTQSSFMLGQAVSEDGYQVHNKNIAQGQSNMLIISAPVTDIVEISRPLLWGFHIFDAERGFSFYWALKIVLLILLSIEIVRKITNKNNLLSLTGGIVLALAPAMMWWFSTAIVDGYIYGMAVVVLVGYYMDCLDSKLWKKILIALGIVICLPGFTFMLYPAFQVPFGFLMMIFIINDFLKNWKKLKLQDFIIISIALISSLGIIARFILLSLEDIKTMMGTVYPGDRIELGGNFTTNGFISYLVNIFFPYTNHLINTCEESSFIYSFTGLIALIVIYLHDLKEKKNNKDFGLIIALIGLYAIFLIWEFVGFKPILAKLSLLYFSPAKRTHVVLGIIGILLSIIMIQKSKNNNTITRLQGCVISLIVVVLSLVLIKQSQYNDFFTPLKIKISLAMIFLLTYFLIRGKVKEWCVVIFTTAIIAGATVNPIAIGISPVNNTNLSKEVKKIVEEDKSSLWIGSRNIEGQYLVANGVNCLNGVHTYPNFNWLKIVDPNGEYNQIYNRFAHISITLADETSFQLLAQDAYNALLTYDDLKKIGAKYYLTFSKLQEETIEKFNLEVKYSDSEKNQYIYQIK